jgi:prepilin signal peptidase PulO-like enzyme (type II secretory pathway)
VFPGVEVAAADLPAWLVRLTAFVFAALWGSFFNVAIHRWPRGMSVVSPPSHCPHCGATVRWYRNIPILGFLGYIFPRADFYGFVGIPEGFPNAYGEFYIALYLMMYPGLLLTVMFAYRLGGGTPGACLKIVWSGVILIFSGFLDVLYYIVNPVGLPETIEYAP